MQALPNAGLRSVCRIQRVVARRHGSVTALLLLPILAFSLATCAVGPDYSRPAAPVPTKFKELKALSGWKLASPSDAFNRGEW